MRRLSIGLTLLVFLLFAPALPASAGHLTRMGPTPVPPALLSSGNTVVLSDAAQLPPASGNGFVVFDGIAYRRQSSTSAGTAVVGYQSGSTFRSYIEWDTTNIPKNLNIQSVGLYLYVSTSYGPGNTVKVVKLNNPISSYPDDDSGNKQLYAGLEAASVYTTSTSFQTAGNQAISLASNGSANTLIADLQKALSTNTPFGVGFVGSNESNASTEFLAKQDLTLTQQHPALVIFGNGLDGFARPPLRPLRTSFWDGSNYFQFVMNEQGQGYYSSPDGITWTYSGQLSRPGPSLYRHLPRRRKRSRCLRAKAQCFPGEL